VPITPIMAQWQSKSDTLLTRTQLPLITAWAITIHKSQGLTLVRVVIDLGENDFALGLSFVAISRCKSLAGIAFRSSFGLARLQKTTQSVSMEDLERDEVRR
ncbi:hypothetical protein SISNIDRAFT_392964, partial [Sistotremastrum niveocremeum HHB9708]